MNPTRLLATALAFSCFALCASSAAHAVTVSSTTTVTPAGMPGVVITKVRTASPATNAWVAKVDLCAAGIRVDATSPTTSTKTVASWATSTGAALAINADFFKTGPLRVYGRAIGGGTSWPLVNTGADPRYDGEWYFGDYGWLAFGDAVVEHNHPRWVKRHTDATGVEEGFETDVVSHDVPPHLAALVSGFPELVHEGVAHTCPNAADGCFPDRSDTDERHPRTAVGITEDRRTLILVVVDGRTASSAGMRGKELADFMKLQGAWWALNLDGGGSSQMWAKGHNLNNTTGNNHGSATRAVANHLGVFIGASTSVPAHCVDLQQEAQLGAAAHDDNGLTDVDGDGTADACLRTPSGLSCALSARADREQAFSLFADDGGWNDPQNFTTIRYGDIDGDGKADVCARADAGLTCRTSRTGPFADVVTGPAWKDESGWNKAKHASTFMLIDVDGDGRDDACARATAGLRCHLSSGTGFGAAIVSSAFSDTDGFNRPERYGTLRSGDVDGDGRVDVCGRFAAGVSCFLAPDFAHRVEGPRWADANGWNALKFWSTLRLVDVDGDGKADLCARTANDFRCHFSTGSGFGAAVIGPTLSDARGWSDDDNASTLRFGDIDGDGDQDLCARANGGVRCWPFANGSFAATAVRADVFTDDEGFTAARFFQSFRVSDVDGDGRADLCARNAAGLRCALATATGFSTTLRAGPAWAGVGFEHPNVWSTLALGRARSGHGAAVVVGEGEGEGEGEAVVGEGEGDVVAGEGEGEGEEVIDEGSDDTDAELAPSVRGGCSQGGAAAAPIVLALLLRRRRR